MTFRPEFLPPWASRPHVTTRLLTRLSSRDGALIIERLTGGKKLPQEVAQQVLERADGIPLFVEELTKGVLESGVLQEDPERYVIDRTLPPLAIPSTLHASLTARLDRLGVVKRVAQMGAAIGREFTYELLAAVASMPEAELRDALDRLVESELVFQRGALPDVVYTFKHALVQDSAHSSLLKSQRQALYARIVDALERQQPQLLEVRPEILAQHCTEAGLLDRAVNLWHLAGVRSVARSAHREAIRHFGRALELLPGLAAATGRDEREVDLRLALAVPLIAVHGFGSAAVEDCAKRAKVVSGSTDQRNRFAVHRLEWNSCPSPANAPDSDTRRGTDGPRMRGPRAGLVRDRTSRPCLFAVYGRRIAAGCSIVRRRDRARRRRRGR
jgi:predicted ATPase